VCVPTDVLAVPHATAAPLVSGGGEGGGGGGEGECSAKGDATESGEGGGVSRSGGGEVQVCLRRAGCGCKDCRCSVYLLS
jgi:hypothetical protein